MTTQCSDNVDNDSDGLIDAEDPECVTADIQLEASSAPMAQTMTVTVDRQ